jgi:hypothetical protein
MEVMGGLRTVQTAILEMLDKGELPTSSEGQTPERPQSGSTTTTRSDERPIPIRYGSPDRRRAVKTLILRYRDEKKLDELPDEELRDEVTNYLQHFDYGKVPTDRIPEVYFEAMAAHGQFLLGVADFVKAWTRLKESAVSGHTLASRAKKPPRYNCSACKGTGKITRAVPKQGVPMWIDADEVEAECVYCRSVSTEMATTT